MVQLTSSQIQTYRVAKELGNPFYAEKVANRRKVAFSTVINHAKALVEAGLIKKERPSWYRVIKDVAIKDIKIVQTKRTKQYRDGLTVNQDSNEQAVLNPKNPNATIEKPTKLPKITYKNGRPYKGIMPTYNRR